MPANDAALVQRVRSALGRDARTRDLPRINVSSCSFVVTLHGSLAHPEEAVAVEEVVRSIPGVEEVVSKLQAN